MNRKSYRMRHLHRIQVETTRHTTKTREVEALVVGGPHGEFALCRSLFDKECLWLLGNDDQDNWYIENTFNIIWIPKIIECLNHYKEV